MIGVLFDWDGVVVDSSRFHEMSWEHLAGEIDLSLPEGHFKKGFGRKNEWIIPNLLDWTHDAALITTWSLRKEALFRELVSEHGIELLPGVRRLLDELADRNIPRVIGSSTHRANIETILEITGIAEKFNAMITAENVSKGKPDPEVFLKAAELSGLPKEQCVVIEDAHVGIEAALAAGIKVVAVATTHPAESLTVAHHVAKDMTEVTADLLASVVG